MIKRNQGELIEHETPEGAPHRNRLTVARVPVEDGFREAVALPPS